MVLKETQRRPRTHTHAYSNILLERGQQTYSVCVCERTVRQTTAYPCYTCTHTYTQIPFTGLPYNDTKHLHEKEGQHTHIYIYHLPKS